MWPPGRQNGGKGSSLLCNFVTRAKLTIGGASSTWLSRLAGLLCFSKSCRLLFRGVHCLSFFCRASLQRRRRGAHTHIGTDMCAHECRDCNDHTPTLDRAELNWASDQTETSEKRHATVTAIGGRRRVQ